MSVVDPAAVVGRSATARARTYSFQALRQSRITSLTPNNNSPLHLLYQHQARGLSDFSSSSPSRPGDKPPGLLKLPVSYWQEVVALASAAELCRGRSLLIGMGKGMAWRQCDKDREGRAGRRSRARDHGVPRIRPAASNSRPRVRMTKRLDSNLLLRLSLLHILFILLHS